jgi:hypothetical protein
MRAVAGHVDVHLLAQCADIFRNVLGALYPCANKK